MSYELSCSCLVVVLWESTRQLKTYGNCGSPVRKSQKGEGNELSCSCLMDTRMTSSQYTSESLSAFLMNRRRARSKACKLAVIRIFFALRVSTHPGTFETRTSHRAPDCCNIRPGLATALGLAPAGLEQPVVDHTCRYARRLPLLDVIQLVRGKVLPHLRCRPRRLLPNTKAVA